MWPITFDRPHISVTMLIVHDYRRTFQDFLVTLRATPLMG